MIIPNIYYVVICHVSGTIFHAFHTIPHLILAMNLYYFHFVGVEIEAQIN